MSTNYSKAELVHAISHTCGVSKKQVDEILTAALQIIREETVAGKTVNLPGFGKFVQKVRPPRMARNPRTGGQIETVEKRLLAFKASRAR